VAEDWLGKWALNPDADQGLDPRVRPSVAVAEIGQRLGWLPQTVRAAITGLRQAGRAKELTTIIDLETGARVIPVGSDLYRQGDVCSTCALHVRGSLATFLGFLPLKR